MDNKTVLATANAVLLEVNMQQFIAEPKILPPVNNSDF
jgi:hypothetical protein